MKQKQGRCRGDWFRTNSLNTWVLLSISEERYLGFSRNERTTRFHH